MCLQELRFGLHPIACIDREPTDGLAKTLSSGDANPSQFPHSGEVYKSTHTCWVI